jgi:hypothetical protein
MRFRIVMSLLFAAILGISGVAAAQELIAPKKIIRQFPTDFCPMPEGITFTTLSTNVTLEFAANLGPGGGYDTHIDNLCIADAFQVATNSGQCSDCPELFDNEGSHPVEAFFFDYFNPDGSVISWLERFDSNPASRGWDLTRGATWNSTYSAVRDPGSVSDFSGGSLRLAGTPACGDSLVRTRITVTGLAPGVTYTLTGWWSATGMILGSTNVEVRIFDQGALIGRSTWGRSRENTFRAGPGGNDPRGIAMVPASDGSAIVVWSDTRNGDDDVFALRVLKNGQIAPGWPFGGVPLCVQAGDQNAAQAVSDGADGAIVSWLDARAGFGIQHIYAQRVTALGTIASGWPNAAAGGRAICTAAGGRTAARIALSPGVGALLTWIDQRVGGSDVYAQRANLAGTVAWTADGVAVSTATGTQSDPKVTTDGAGGAFVGYTGPSGGGSNVWLQRIGTAGTIASGWPAASVGGVQVASTTSLEFLGDIVNDGGTGAYVSWYLSGITSPRIQRMTSAGAVASGWPASGVATGGGACSGIATRTWVGNDGAGGVVQIHACDGSSRRMHIAQRLTSAGAIAPGWPAAGKPLNPHDQNRFLEQPAFDGLGGAWLAWCTATGGFAETLYVQRVLGSGVVPSGWAARGQSMGYVDLIFTPMAFVRPDTTHGVLAWRDLTGEVKLRRVDRFGSMGNPAPWIRAVVDHAGDHGGVVDVRWDAGDLVNDSNFKTNGIYRFYRAVDETHPPDWRLVATQPASNVCARTWQAQTSFIAPASGGSPGFSRYRVEGYDPNTGWSWMSEPDSGHSVNDLGPLAVEGLEGAEFALASPSPNPGRGVIGFSFTLAEASDVELEVFDIAGRALWRKSLAHAAAGQHQVRWDGRSLEGGVYFLRARSNLGERTRRFVLLP